MSITQKLQGVPRKIPKTKVGLWTSYWRERHLVYWIVDLRVTIADFCDAKSVTIRSLVFIWLGGIQQWSCFAFTKICALEITCFCGMISRSVSFQDGFCFHVKIVSTNYHRKCLQQKGNIKSIVSEGKNTTYQHFTTNQIEYDKFWWKQTKNRISLNITRAIIKNMCNLTLTKLHSYYSKYSNIF